MISLKSIGTTAACIALVSALAFTLAAPALAASMGTSGGHDLDELYKKAGRQSGFTDTDAALLLEARHVFVGTDGQLKTRVHRVVRVATSMGVRDHADLRIPYNSDTSAMTVEVLRTWRDERWWPDETKVSATAVVETLPFDLASADDYTGMRETMLLHDGVGLPCVMETAYEIEERGGAANGTDGLFVFAQRDPAVLVELVVTVAAPQSLVVRYENGAPEPEVTRGDDGSVTYTWRMENVARLGTPAIADPTVYAPYVSWSTWGSWDALGREVVERFGDAAVLGGALADTIGARLANEPSAAARARCIAAFVDEAVRSIHYDSRFWSFSPRAASRTYETAYGHGLDRAVLAAALFRSGGLEAEPAYRSAGARTFQPDVPGLSRFEPIGVWVTADGVEAYYDPVEGTLTDGTGPLYGRTVWRPKTEPEPSPGPGLRDPEATSEFTLVLTVEPDAEGALRGTGFLRAAGLFSPHGDMAGLHGEALALLGEIAGSVLPGSVVEAFNPEAFARDQVAVGFSFKGKVPEADDRGRLALVIGDPAGGVMTWLPHDVHLYDERRDSPAVLPGAMTQRIALRLKTGGREVLQLPRAHRIDNGVGGHAVTVEEKDGWIVVERELALRASNVGSDEWRSLRALLLEEADPVNRTIFLK